ncbi:MAG: response regulator [Candidatus Hydrogenedens sp.]|nr:response regulator [Candidatus Hydrogenedens sp.]
MHAITICIVEDYQDEALVLSEGLKLFGYETVIAGTGYEALNLCRQGGVHLVLLDVGLPDMDGYEVCRQLKADPQTMDIPVIFVTARGDAGDVEQGYALGALDYVAKPYNLPMVIVHIDAALRTRQGGTELVSGPYMLIDPAYTDQLTGLRNRRFLIERLQEESAKAYRYDYHLSCLMLEVEEAPQDGLGDRLPDELLVEVAMTLRKSSRTFDIVARYDEAQFAAVLPHTNLDNAVAYGRKIQHELSRAIAASSCVLKEPRVCMGITTYYCNKQSEEDKYKRPDSAEEFLGASMNKLLIAKNNAPEFIVAGETSGS